MSVREKIVDLVHKYWFGALIIGYLLFTFSKDLLPQQVVMVLRVVLACCAWFICIALCGLCVNGIKRVRKRAASPGDSDFLSMNNLLVFSGAGELTALVVLVISAPAAYFTRDDTIIMIALISGIGAFTMLTIYSLLVLRSSSRLIKETQARISARKAAS